MSEIDEIDCQTVSRSGPSKPREGAEGRQAPDQKRPSAAGAEPTARPASVFHWREPVPQSPFHSPRPHGFPATATTATTATNAANATNLANATNAANTTHATKPNATNLTNATNTRSATNATAFAPLGGGRVP